jgi:hypothetical protein
VSEYPPAANRELAGIWAMLQERHRLAALADAELVAECVKLDAADYPVVEEMMNRLNPTWFEEKPL